MRRSHLFAVALLLVAALLPSLTRAWTDGQPAGLVLGQANFRVLRFDNAASKPDGANADGVLGQTNYADSGSASTASGLKGPFGLATDDMGNVWVPDSGNNRVLVFKNPTEVAITRADANPINAATADFDVTFSSPVTGLSATNFALTASGVSGASITDVTGSGTDWTVTAATGSGVGTLRLDMVNSTGVQNGNGDPVANVPYTGGEGYTIHRYVVLLPLVRQ